MPLKRLNPEWRPSVYPYTQSLINNAVADLMPGSSVPMSAVTPRVVVCRGAVEPSPEPRYAVLLGNPYSEIKGLENGRLVVGTTNEQGILRMGALAVGERVGDRGGRPVVAVRVGSTDTINFLGVLNPWSFKRLPTTSLDVAGSTSASHVADAFDEAEIIALVGSEVPIVESYQD